MARRSCPAFLAISGEGCALPSSRPCCRRLGARREDRSIGAGSSASRRASRSPATSVTHRLPGHAQSPQSWFSARHGGVAEIGGHGRQFLDLARTDVSLRRPHDADDVEAITAQAYVEMLEAGFTGSANFTMFITTLGRALCQSRRARRTRRGGSASQRHRADAVAGVLCACRLRRPRADAGQRRFLNSVDRFSRLMEASRRAVAGSKEPWSASHRIRCARSRRTNWRPSCRSPGWSRFTSISPSKSGSRRLHRLERERPVHWLLDHAAVDRAGAWSMRPT